MIKIRRIRDVRAPADIHAVAEAQAILKAQLPGVADAEIDGLRAQLDNPEEHGFQAELLVSEDNRSTVRGFAILLFMADLNIAYLKLIATAPGRTGSGLGAALYGAVRDEAKLLGATGLYFESLPDDPKLSPDPKTRRQNAARLAFYERHGARPILGTSYEIDPDGDEPDSPYLMFDDLDEYDLPDPPELQAVIEAIIGRIYPDFANERYFASVREKIAAGDYHPRPTRYRADLPAAFAHAGAKIPLVINDRHSIHHIRERGYVEAPIRVEAILRELRQTDLFVETPAKSYPDRWIREVHDNGLVDFLQQACAEAPAEKSIYPYVFPIRNQSRVPKERSVLAGYWCIDTFTPINRNAYPAARHAVDCVLTAAESVSEGSRLAYALVRPPGHHAEHANFGGFCYFSNAAIGAHFLSRKGKVAILDIDYHHGNGQQDIFYERSNVLTVSIHGDPSFAYPYFSGFADERGRGAGAGYNLNIPLPEAVTPEEYREAVGQGLKRIARYRPDYLVLALGYDTGKGDPTGTWANRPADFGMLGEMIGSAGYPTLVVQEGGYRVRTVGTNARHFFTGLARGAAGTPPRPKASGKPEKAAVHDLSWRDTVTAADIEPIRRLVAGTEVFNAEEVAIAAELASERVTNGRASTYEFVIAEEAGEIVGYSCFGRTPATESMIDLYWIVVSADHQGKGIGERLLRRTEDAARLAGGTRLLAETSGTQPYAGTRTFYRKTGFRKVAELPDFYRIGDPKIILMKGIEQ